MKNNKLKLTPGVVYFRLHGRPPLSSGRLATPGLPEPSCETLLTVLLELRSFFSLADLSSTSFIFSGQISPTSSFLRPHVGHSLLLFDRRIPENPGSVPELSQGLMCALHCRWCFLWCDTRSQPLRALVRKCAMDAEVGLCIATVGPRYVWFPVLGVRRLGPREQG
ncbi:hypothetical protein J6590_042451 [Homalodisca vitripennis]|nr:hypothetical protein J6590_042451 [Homalodisca vitripennis]